MIALPTGAASDIWFPARFFCGNRLFAMGAWQTVHLFDC
jgi:hypothetical protein